MVDKEKIRAHVKYLSTMSWKDAEQGSGGDMAAITSETIAS